MSIISSTISLSELVLQNIVTINQSSLVKNFRMISQSIAHFCTLQQKMNNLEKAHSNLMDQTEKHKKKQQKETAQLRSLMKGLAIAVDSGNVNNFISNINTPALKGNSQTVKVSNSNTLSNKNMDAISKQIQLLQGRTQALIFQQISKLRQQQQQSTSIKKIEKQIQELKQKVEQLSMNKSTENKISNIGNLVDQLTKQLKSYKSQQDKQVSENKNSFQLINKNFSIIQTKIQSFKLEQDNDKLKLKIDCSELFKLEEMLLGMLDTSINQLIKKMADKQETKKALIFLEKRINKVIGLIVGQTSQQSKDAIIATKTWKCVSCTKDLGQYEGKLGQYQPWAVFPTKNITKQKYHGFGQGFQDAVEKVIQKKGVQANFDNFGRMTVPHNLTREVSITGSRPIQTPSGKKVRSNSQSQSKLRSDSIYQGNQVGTGVSNLETNFMSNFGGNYQGPLNISQQYKKRYKGINEYVITSIRNGNK